MIVLYFCSGIACEHGIVFIFGVRAIVRCTIRLGRAGYRMCGTPPHHYGWRAVDATQLGRSKARSAAYQAAETFRETSQGEIAAPTQKKRRSEERLMKLELEEGAHRKVEMNGRFFGEMDGNGQFDSQTDILVECP